MAHNWLELLHQPGYTWDATFPGATQEQISQVEAYFRRQLPSEYVALLRVTNGGDLSYRDLWLIHFWPAQHIPSWSQAYGFTAETMPDAFPFADDGGSEALVFDMRPSHPAGEYPILAVNFITVGWAEALRISDSFRDLVLLRHALLEGAQREPS